LIVSLFILLAWPDDHLRNLLSTLLLDNFLNNLFLFLLGFASNFLTEIYGVQLCLRVGPRHVEAHRLGYSFRGLVEVFVRVLRNDVKLGCGSFIVRSWSCLTARRVKFPKIKAFVEVLIRILVSVLIRLAHVHVDGRVVVVYERDALGTA
jgi:hypothetical protein